MQTRRHSLALLIALALTGPVIAQTTLFVSPDVPTAPDGPTNYLPWEVVEQTAGSYAPALSIPGNPAIDALHRMDAQDSWLFSVGAPYDLGGAGFVAQPADIVRWAAGVPTLFLDGSCLAAPIPSGANVDALTQFFADTGTLLLVFDAPTTIAGQTYQPTEVLQYQGSMSDPCSWTILDSFDLKLLSTGYHPPSARITGIDTLGNGVLMVAFDIPVDVSPTSGASTTRPNEIAIFELGTGSWSTLADLEAEGSPGWPLGSLIDGLSCDANPGQLTAPLELSAGGFIQCPSSCSSGGSQFGVYQGTLASLRNGIYDHEPSACDESCPGAIDISADDGVDRYYLLVPHNGKEEGTYGTDSAGNERPRATGACAPYQLTGLCP